MILIRKNAMLPYIDHLLMKGGVLINQQIKNILLYGAKLS